MGFDIYGKAPRSEAGRYFAANWECVARDRAGMPARCAGPMLADR